MNASHRWQCLVLATCAVSVVAGLSRGTMAIPVAAASDGKDSSACVRQISDVSGDGVPDYAVSFPSTHSGATVVYLVAGHRDGRRPKLDQVSLRSNLVGVLNGPAAMPYVCLNESIERPGETGAAGQSHRDPPIIDTLIDRPVRYRMVDLNPLTPGGMVANRINDAGHVVGQFLNADGFERAFVYDGAVVHDLGTLGGHLSEARSINRSGQIVGSSLTGVVDNFGFVNAAFASDGVQMRSLNLDWSAASAINDAGVVAGEMRVTQGVDLTHAFILAQGVATELGSLPPLTSSAYSSAHSLNETGQVVGQSNTYVLGTRFPTTRYAAVRAFIYEQGAMRDLGSLGKMCTVSPNGLAESCYENSVATDINNSGTIAGFSSTPTTVLAHAILSDGQNMQDLGTLGGSASWAYGVNDSTQVVGQFASADSRTLAPFLYERGTMYELNALIVNPSAAMPFAAYDINNFGEIAGNHHVLYPLYEQVAPGGALAFMATLGRTFRVAYWASRRDVAACNTATSQLQVEVAFEVPGETAASWISADLVSGCADSTDWHEVSVTIPGDLQGTQTVVRVRVNELGPATNPSLYLRHFRME